MLKQWNIFSFGFTLLSVCVLKCTLYYTSCWLDLLLIYILKIQMYIQTGLDYRFTGILIIIIIIPCLLNQQRQKSYEPGWVKSLSTLSHQKSLKSFLDKIASNGIGNLTQWCYTIIWCRDDTGMNVIIRSVILIKAPLIVHLYWLWQWLMNAHTSPRLMASENFSIQMKAMKVSHVPA